MVTSPIGNCSPMAGADNVPFEAADFIDGEVAATEDMEMTALITGLDGAY